MVQMQASEVRRSMAIAATSSSDDTALHNRAISTATASMRSAVRSLASEHSSHAMADPPPLPEDDHVRSGFSCGLDHLTHKTDVEAEVR